MQTTAYGLLEDILFPGPRSTWKMNWKQCCWLGHKLAIDRIMILDLSVSWFLVPNTQAHNCHLAFSASTTYHSLCSIKIFEINRLKRCESNSLHKSQCIFCLRKEKSYNFLESLKTHKCVDYTNSVICTCHTNELCVISVERQPQVLLPWWVCHYPCRLVEVKTSFQKLCIPHWLIPRAQSPCYRRSDRWSQHWTLRDHENNPDCLDRGRRLLGTWWLKYQMRKSRLLRSSVFHRVYSLNSWQIVIV